MRIECARGEKKSGEEEEMNAKKRIEKTVFEYMILSEQRISALHKVISTVET